MNNFTVTIQYTGSHAKAKVSEGGFIALTWFDEENQRPRISVGYAGENIKADTWYVVNSSGELMEAA